eukprot:9503959-Pyramimonas_sp.AAC.2
MIERRLSRETQLKYRLGENINGEPTLDPTAGAIVPSNGSFRALLGVCKKAGGVEFSGKRSY